MQVPAVKSNKIQAQRQEQELLTIASPKNVVDQESIDVSSNLNNKINEPSTNENQENLKVGNMAIDSSDNEAASISPNSINSLGNDSKLEASAVPDKMTKDSNKTYKSLQIIRPFSLPKDAKQNEANSQSVAKSVYGK